MVRMDALNSNGKAIKLRLNRRIQSHVNIYKYGRRYDRFHNTSNICSAVTLWSVTWGTSFNLSNNQVRGFQRIWEISVSFYVTQTSLSKVERPMQHGDWLLFIHICISHMYIYIGHCDNIKLLLSIWFRANCGFWNIATMRFFLNLPLKIRFNTNHNLLNQVP